MKKYLILTLVLAGCAQVMASNEKSITIKAPPAAEPMAYEKAQIHCEQFGKDAIASGTTYNNTVVFRCE